MPVYVDSSAFVKMVIAETGSVAMRAYLRQAHTSLASSALLRTEGVRAVRREGPEALSAARQLLRAIDLIALDDSVLDAAAMLEPHNLRTLDAIHLATALAIGDDLDMIVTYDKRMTDSAMILGLPVVSP
jgi:uncharacterized protein